MLAGALAAPSRIEDIDKNILGAVVGFGRKVCERCLNAAARRGARGRSGFRKRTVRSVLGPLDVRRPYFAPDLEAVRASLRGRRGRPKRRLPRTARNARCARRGGAPWIANVVGNGFHANVDGEHPDDDDFFMNDFFHAAEHLHALIAELVRKPEDAAAQFERLKDLMWSKGAERACKDVVKTFGLPKKGTEARKQYDYLWERRRFMRYEEFRELQLFIGTGVMEAACRTDVARRCKQSGMHWRVFNASAMCALVARIRTQRKAA